MEKSAQSKLTSNNYFDQIADLYHESVKTWASLYKQVGKIVNPLLRGKTVVDVGSGGIFSFDPDLPRQLIVVDVAKEMLAKIINPKVIKMVADARELSGIEDNSVDVINYSLVIHHINGDSRKESLASLERLLTCAFRKLKPGGYLLIMEPILIGPLFWMESLIFPFTHWVLSKLNSPMIYIYSLSALLNAIGASCRDLKETPSTTDLRILEKRVDPLPGCFPGVFTIPTWLHPVKFKLIIAQKHSPRLDITPNSRSS